VPTEEFRPHADAERPSAEITSGLIVSLWDKFVAEESR